MGLRLLPHNGVSIRKCCSVEFFKRKVFVYGPYFCTISLYIDNLYYFLSLCHAICSFRQQGGIIVAGPGKTNISYIHKVSISFYDDFTTHYNNLEPNLSLKKRLHKETIRIAEK